MKLIQDKIEPDKELITRVLENNSSHPEDFSDMITAYLLHCALGRLEDSERVKIFLQESCIRRDPWAGFINRKG